MLLYKYLSFERKSILEDGLIRYTQPSCLNDPFEALPNIEGYFSNEFVTRLFDNLLDENLFNNFIKKSSNKDSINSLKELRSSLIDKTPEEIKVFYNRLTQGDSSESPTESMRLYWDEHVGILSLSEENDDLTMWSHYTEDHKGFLIGFNPLKEITDSSKNMIKIKKVVYSSVRPSFTLFELNKDKKARNKQWISDFLFTKSIEWSYENEWRQVNYLKKADKVLEKGNDIYLFKCNLESIEQIYFGCNMTSENKNDILELVKDWNVAIFEMKLNSKHYNLDKIRIK